MAETGWLSRTEMKELQRLGWDLQAPCEFPSKVPLEDQLPVDERCEHLTVDVQDHL